MSNGLALRCRALDKKGKVLRDTGMCEANSWVKNHYQITFCNAAAAHYTSTPEFRVIDTNGNPNGDTHDRGFFPFLDSWRLGALDDDDVGIVVGTGNAAVTFDDYAMDTKIISGTGAGELIYNAMAESSVNNSPGASITITHYRTFTNNSGGTIWIQELGYIVRSSVYTGSNLYFLICRDAITAFAVENAEILEVYYEIAISIP